MFIAFIGLQGSGITVPNEATIVSLGHFTSPTVLICLFGLLVIVLLEKRNIKGAILFGILASTLAAWGYALWQPEYATALGIYLPEGIIKFESIAPIAGKIDFNYILNPETIGTFITIVCTFLFVDFFDTIGTFVGVASRAEMIDKNGNVPRGGKALMVDAVGTTVGACLGVSTVTTFVESSTGVAAGGRTGWTAITTGVLFLLAMFFSPIFIAIPGCATAPALIYVGYLMLTAVKEIDFSDIGEGLPAFITIAFMPLTYSIGDGLTFGVLSYVAINCLYNVFFAKEEEKNKNISSIMIVLAVLFLIKLIFM